MQREEEKEMAGKTLHQEKKAPFEMKTNQGEKELQKGPSFLEGQGESLFSSKQAVQSPGDGLDPPMQEAPAHKHTRTLGKLQEKERTGTHSDVQREAFKRNLLQNIAMDSKGSYSAEFQYTLELLKQYAEISITGDSDKALLEQERSLLQTVVQSMKFLSERLGALGVRNQKQQKELDILNVYLNYFVLDVDGYLQVPETETETEKLEDYTGVAMKGTHEVRVERENPEKPGEMVMEKEKVPIVMKDVPKEQPLFPHEPSLNDIAQGGLGDCYLLAALSAVVNMSPQFIKDCMRDNGDGTVTVRFFEVPAKDSDPTLTHYVKIKKAVPDGDVYSRGSLWVQLIEHAYAASGLHIKGDNKEENQDQLFNYDTISGGNSAGFVQTITGRRMESHHLDFREKGATLSQIYDIVSRTIVQQEKEAHPERTALTNPGDILFALLLGAENTAIPDLSTAEGMAETMERLNLQVAYIQFFDSVKEKVKTAEDAREFFSKLDYEKLPDIPGYDKKENSKMKKRFIETLRDTFISLDNSPLLSRAFSGSYTKREERVYQDIQAAEQAGKIMVGHTEKTFDAPVNKQGLNGESVELGMVSNHAYTVLGVKQLGDNKYIKLRNPWAQGTRSYQQNTITNNVTRERKDDDTHGIFLLELSEFIACFVDYSTL